MREYIIHINSKDCVQVNNQTENIVFNLREPLSAEYDEEIYVELLTATIPVSFYSVNSTNSWLDIEEDNNGILSSFSVQIDQGNYNIIQALNAFQHQVNTHSPNNWTYSFTYNKYNNKATVSLTSGDSSKLLFKTGANHVNDCQYLLGFKDIVDTVVSYGHPISSTATCNINPFSNIYIYNTSLGINNQYTSKTGGLSQVLSKIPAVNAQSFGYIYYTNYLFLKYKCGVQNIENIDLQLRDHDNLLIELNNMDWYCSLKVMFVKKEKYNLLDMTEQVPVEIVDDSNIQ
jgi:hypothetical protein